MTDIGPKITNLDVLCLNSELYYIVSTPRNDDDIFCPQLSRCISLSIKMHKLSNKRIMPHLSVTNCNSPDAEKEKLM